MSAANARRQVAGGHDRWGESAGATGCWRRFALYAADRLERRGGADAAHDRHLEWYLALTERAAPELRGPRGSEWLARLDEEYDNIRAALAWSLGGGDCGSGLRLAALLWWYWFAAYLPLHRGAMLD